MASPYARTDAWPDWQRPYRLGVVLVLPPNPVRAEIDLLRARYDSRSHAAAPAHISLTVPLQREPDERRWGELARVAQGFAPFPIRYGPLVPFLPKPGAALESCEVFAGAGPRAFPFWAHITIAEFVSVETTQELVREIGGDRAPSGIFVCDRLSYLVPDDGFRFTERRVLPCRH